MFGQFSQRSFPISVPSRPSMTPVNTPVSRTHFFGQSQSVIFNPTAARSQPRRVIMTVKEGSSRMDNHFPTENSRDSQKLISQYFKESKNIEREPDHSARGTKRNLKDLQRKYDNIYSQPIQVPPVIELPRFRDVRETSQRTAYAEQMTGEDLDFLPKRSRPSQPQSQPKNVINQKLKNIKSDEKIEPKSIHLVGYVENVLRWNETLKNLDLHVMYNVLGTFISVMDGTHAYEKFVFIRGNNGTILECSFFENDRPLPKLTKGQHVTCFGNVTGAQRLRLYSIDTVNESVRTDAQRAIFLSQRATYELSDRKIIL